MGNIQKLIAGTLITLGALSLFGYWNKSNAQDSQIKKESIVRTLNGVDYEVQGDKLIQKTEDEDKTARFGVIADPHGFYEHVDIFSKHFKKKGLDGIVLLGDYAQHFRQKPHMGMSDYDEIVKCLEAAAKTGMPVYVIPGNHEMKVDYEKAIETLSQNYNNIFDLSKIRIVDGDDFDFVSSPNGNDNGFSYFSDSFLGNNKKIMNEIIKYSKQLKQDDDPEVLITHQPPKCKGKYGIDVIPNGKKVGNDHTDKAMKTAEIDFSLSGHIHEAGGRGCTSKGKLVKPKVFSDDLRFNPGSAGPWRYLTGEVFKGMAGIFTIEGNKAKYDIIVLK